MATNRGATHLRRRRRCADPMRDYDRLPAELRRWLASAAFPWSPRSVRRAFERALARTRDTSAALAELDQLQWRLVAKDVRRVWGADHPVASMTRSP